MSMELTPSKVYEGEQAPDGVTIESILNREDGTLPFGLFNPQTEGKLTWICNYGTEGDIISVFCFDYGDHSDRDVKILADLKEALYVRDTLIENGWKKLIPPKIEFTTSSADGTPKPLNRKKKRYLGKKIKQIGRQQNHAPDKPSEDFS